MTYGLLFHSYVRAGVKFYSALIKFHDCMRAYIAFIAGSYVTSYTYFNLM